MAVTRPVQQLSLQLKEEITSRRTSLMRMVHKDPVTGFFQAEFPVQIQPESITYEVDVDGNKTDIYEQKDLEVINLTFEEASALWTKVIRKEDGSEVQLGAFLSDEIDAILAVKFP
jgi:hypothetical protein